MSREIARKAAQFATGESPASVEPFASGRTSDAWLAETSRGSWIVRIPVAQSGRRVTYRAEAVIGAQLTQRGHPVADWTIIEITRGRPSSVARLLPGSPVDYETRWTPEFARALALVLGDLHALPATGFGPLNSGDDALYQRGISPSRRAGIVDRFVHAAIWPFDGSTLEQHPLMGVDPNLCDEIGRQRAAIEAAAEGPLGLVHSDLHREHLLQGPDGSLTGLLDFGDAFVGAVGWDFALLHWYYGLTNARMVARNHPGGSTELANGAALALAFGLYKLAKNPTDRSVLPRLRRCAELRRPGTPTRPVLPRTIVADTIELRQFTSELVADTVASMLVSLEELAPWFPWAQQPPTVAEQLVRAQQAEQHFAAGTDFEFVLVEPSTNTVVGGFRVNPEAGPGVAEFGYWVRSDRHRRGYAGMAVRAGIQAVFDSLDDIDEVQVHMATANVASAGVARSAGLTFSHEIDRPIAAPGHTGRAFVWRIGRP